VALSSADHDALMCIALLQSEAPGTNFIIGQDNA